MTLDDTIPIPGGSESADEIVGGQGHDTLAEAHDALSSDGGSIRIAETVTERGDVEISKRVRLVGTGASFDKSAPAYVDLDGNTLHVTSSGNWIEAFQVQNGNVIIGTTGEFGGRQNVDLSVINSPSFGIELRGGHLDCFYDISARLCGGDGIRFYLEHDAGPDDDYFNENMVWATAHNNGGDGIVVTDPDIGSEFRGNEFRRLESELNTGTGLVVDGVNFFENRFTGYGIEGSESLDVNPSTARGNFMHLTRYSGTGFAKFGGVIMGPPAELREITTEGGTQLRVTPFETITQDGGTASSFTISESLGRVYQRRQVTEVGTIATDVGGITRSGLVVVSGQDPEDNTVNFVDLLLMSAFDGVDVIHSRERGTVPARNYTVNGSTLDLAMASGTFNVGTINVGHYV